MRVLKWVSFLHRPDLTCSAPDAFLDPVVVLTDVRPVAARAGDFLNAHDLVGNFLFGCPLNNTISIWIAVNIKNTTDCKDL